MAYLGETHTSDDITEMVDEEINSGNWVDEDDLEESECEDAYDYYQNHNNGEAEEAVRDQLVVEIENRFGITREDYLLETGEELYETIEEKYEDLSKS